MNEFFNKCKIVTNSITKSIELSPRDSWSLVKILKLRGGLEESNFKFLKGKWHFHNDNVEIVDFNAFRGMSWFEDEIQFYYNIENKILTVRIGGPSHFQYEAYEFFVKEPQSVPEIVTEIDEMIKSHVRKIRQKELKQIEEDAENRILEQLLEKVSQ